MVVNNPDEIMALDVGDKRIGIARANRIARIPEPLKIISVDGTEHKAILDIVDTQGTSAVVVGIPRNMSGEETEQSAKIRKWAETLRPKLEEKGLSMSYWDETLSSVGARARSSAKHIDDHAAGIILESYLE